MARLTVVMAVATALTGCLGPQMEVRVENESEESVVVEIAAGGHTERSEVFPNGGVEFRAADRDGWTLSVNGELVADSTAPPRSQGPILNVHIDRAGEVRVARTAEG